MSLADRIEKHIRDLLRKSELEAVRISRNRLAEEFMCVPSQINYVLATRFGIEQGFLVESRRGGGGYLTITKLSLSSCEELQDLVDASPQQIPEYVADGLIRRLREEDFLTQREALLMRSLIKREAIPLGLPERDIVRGHIIQTLLKTIMRNEFSR